jgi:hypothetical protein
VTRSSKRRFRYVLHSAISHEIEQVVLLRVKQGFKIVSCSGYTFLELCFLGMDVVTAIATKSSILDVSVENTTTVFRRNSTTSV